MEWRSRCASGRGSGSWPSTAGWSRAPRVSPVRPRRRRAPRRTSSRSRARSAGTCPRIGSHPANRPASTPSSRHVDVVISVHGYFRPEWTDAVYVGRRATVTWRPSSPPGCGRCCPICRWWTTWAPSRERCGASDPRNPVNGTRGGGVQLELPHVAAARRVRRAHRRGGARLTDVLTDFAIEQSVLAA